MPLREEDAGIGKSHERNQFAIAFHLSAHSLPPPLRRPLHILVSVAFSSSYGAKTKTRGMDIWLRKNTKKQNLQVAVKYLRPATPFPDVLSEISVLSALHECKQVVDLVDVVRSSHGYWTLVLEYAHGGDMKSWLQARARASPY